MNTWIVAVRENPHIVNQKFNRNDRKRAFFDYLKEKVGERKTKTGAYCDLLEKRRQDL